MAPEIQAVFEAFSAWQALVWIAAAIAAVVGIRKAWPAISRFVATINALGELPEFIAKTNKTLQAQNALLATIKHEVLPNSGGSMRDAVDRQGVALKEVNDKLAKDHVRIEVLEHTIPRDELGRFSKKEE